MYTEDYDVDPAPDSNAKKKLVQSIIVPMKCMIDVMILLLRYINVQQISQSCDFL